MVVRLRMGIHPVARIDVTSDERIPSEDAFCKWGMCCSPGFKGKSKVSQALGNNQSEVSSSDGVSCLPFCLAGAVISRAAVAGTLPGRSNP